jgi:hypothetical protein
MPHLEWLVPVLLLVLWIVSSLLQGLEKERARATRQRSLADKDRPPGERPTRRPPSDIDRFLEEVNRRRRQAAERRPASGGKEKPPLPSIGPVTAAPRPRAAPRPASGSPAMPVQPMPSPPAKIAQALPVTPVTVAAEILAVASALHQAPAPSASPAQPAAAVPAISTKEESASAELPSFLDLLRTPDNLRTAVILHQIFASPRARRR